MADDITAEVKKIIKEQLEGEVDDIRLESSFIDDRGADSLGLVELGDVYNRHITKHRNS